MKITNKLSRYFGKFANFEFFYPFQILINWIYVAIFKIDLRDFDPLSNYKSLNALFSRSLKVQREFNKAKDILISPTDSLITHSGEVKSYQALQIKGMEYNVNELLGEESFKDGYFYINFYLSPKDYHHYHAPCDMEVLEVRYFAGELLPVNHPSLNKNKDLFIKNERVVVLAKDKNNEIMYFVAVGALNVGQMILHFEPKIQTNNIANKNTLYCYNTPIAIKKAEELGMFKMGSTVLIFAKNIAILKENNTEVKFGESIACFKN